MEAKASTQSAEQTTPGRHCPLSYRYTPQALASCRPLHTDTLYVVGGLYGNGAALDEIEAMASLDTDARVRLVFNGDFNWFNVDPAEFESINTRVLTHLAIKGNVEAELGDPSSAGCGCNYPDFTDNATVQRSNRIMERLARTSADFPAITRRLATLPRFLVATVGNRRVGLVHGDLHSLAGWGFDQSNLPADAETRDGRALIDHFRRARLDVVASTHTCLPCAQDYPVDGHHYAVINNGSAGMPNFRDDARGLLTRISVFPSPIRSLYGMRIGGIHVDAVPIPYDGASWKARFHSQWPEGSPARASYDERISRGPHYVIESAARGGFSSSGQVKRTLA